jgi:general stress protein 26
MAASETTTQRDRAIQKLNEMIRGIRIAMLTTATTDGALRSRPMVAQQIDFDGELWFFTGWESGKVHDLMNNAHVNVSYAQPESNRYVSFAGKTTIVRDRHKAEELWNPAYRAWFPKGLDDPNLALLKVQVDSAEYWDVTTGAMVHIFARD